MREDVSADGLAAVGAGEEGGGAGVGLDLVCLHFVSNVGAGPGEEEGRAGAP